MPEDLFRIVRGGDGLRRHDPAAARARLEGRSLPTELRSLRSSVQHFQVDKPLETAINTALALGAPLLLTGEPGTGKTSVAHYLAAYFETELFDFQVKSTSTAQDLKWEFDAVAYLRTTKAGAPDEDRERFLHPRALWLAYGCARTPVVLIDEIDKAPRDLPNDLLQELDAHKFLHPFRRPDQPDAWIEPRAGPPIVVVTSNAERRLPDAFLRRCIHHRLELTRELIQRAVEAHRRSYAALADADVERAIERFFELRRKSLEKKPATAELLAWLVFLGAHGIEDGDWKKADSDLPGIGVLIKTTEDLQALR